MELAHIEKEQSVNPDSQHLTNNPLFDQVDIYVRLGRPSNNRTSPTTTLPHLVISSHEFHEVSNISLGQSQIQANLEVLENLQHRWSMHLLGICNFDDSG